MDRDSLYLGGRWRAPESSERVETADSNTGKRLGSYVCAGPAEVDSAVTIARATLHDRQGWAGYSPHQRAAVMRRFADAIERRRDSLGELISREVGTPVERSRFSNADTASALLRFYADIIVDTDLEDLRPAGRGHSLVRREAVGVVGMIVPWNFPLSTLFFKLAPALATGCAAVIKPATLTALSAFLVAEAAAEAGVPDGVINILPCDRTTGEYLAAHPGVDKVAFTGSTAAGRRIGRICGETLTPVTLELGGKSAALLLEDAPIDTLIAELHDLSFSNNGQACTNSSRLIVPARIYDEVVDAIAVEVSGWKVAGALEPGTVIGPVVSARHRDSIERYYDVAVREGGRVVVGGAPRREEGGFFVEPSVFADVAPEMTIFREEVFGPAISITKYSGELEEGLSLVNDSEYGLAGAVYTADETLGIETARRFETGTVALNMSNFDIGAPFGGRKNSGVGYELGAEAIRAYLHYKTIFTPRVPAGF